MMAQAEADRERAGPVPQVAVIGCGYWGRNHVRNYAELGALAAVWDRHPDRAQALADLHGAPVRSYEDILADPFVDAVVLALPPSQHHPFGQRALEAGKHVFVEKPMALDMGEARALCDTADRLDRRLMVGHILQYHPAFAAVLDLLQRGEIGRLFYVSSNRLNLGKVRREEDAFWALAPHDVSMILSLVGSEPPQVDASGGAYLHTTIADMTSAQLVFPGGEQAHIAVSWLHPFKEQKLTVVGSKGMLVFDDGEPWERKVMRFGYRIEGPPQMPSAVKEEGVPVPLEPKEPLRQECLHFLDCIRTGARPRTDGWEGLRVLSVLTRVSEALSRRRAA